MTVNLSKNFITFNRNKNILLEQIFFKTYHKLVGPYVNMKISF